MTRLLCRKVADAVDHRGVLLRPSALRRVPERILIRICRRKYEALRHAQECGRQPRIERSRNVRPEDEPRGHGQQLQQEAHHARVMPPLQLHDVRTRHRLGDLRRILLNACSDARLGKKIEEIALLRLFEQQKLVAIPALGSKGGKKPRKHLADTAAHVRRDMKHLAHRHSPRTSTHPNDQTIKTDSKNLPKKRTPDRAPPEAARKRPSRYPPYPSVCPHHMRAHRRSSPCTS